MSKHDQQLVAAALVKAVAKARRRSRALIAVFEGWQHGQPVVVAEAEYPEQQERAS